MKCKLLSAALVALASLGTGLAVQAAAPDAATMLVNTCVGCHGPNGSSGGPATPTIAGMASDTFLDYMKAYQDGSRPATVMDRIAKGYTEDELKLMANFFVKQKFVRIAQTTDPAKVKAGQALHKNHCSKCHEDNGRKDEDGSGVLAGQWLPYLLYSVEDFSSGKREMAKKMAAQVKKVKEADPNGLESLMHFYASQK
jgi:cytochrome subunit of sulfide dehydrogenase